jgi:hypothetical protein
MNIATTTKAELAKIQAVNSMPTLLVSVNYNAGHRTVYPECPTSWLFANMINAHTLPDATIDYIKELGYTFKVKVEEI